MERTLVLAKPDAYARRLSGEILARFERKGLTPVALRVMTMTREMAERHYAEHLAKPFFGELADVHHVRAARRDGARGALGDRRGPPADRRDQPAGGRARVDPRRSRDRDRREPRPRLRRPRGGGPRDRDFFPELSTFVLASRSPQRRAILDAVGVAFVVREPDFDETLSGPAERIARPTRSARHCAVARAPGRGVLGVDTIVSLGARNSASRRDSRSCAGDPRGRSRGATHAVLSGLASWGLGRTALRRRQRPW